MASPKSEYVITSFSAKKYNPVNKTFTAYTPSTSGEINVSANDIIKFQHPRDNTKSIPLNSISIYAITNDMKVQINDDSSNAIFIEAGGAKAIDDIQINSIKFLTSGRVYFDGLTPIGFLPIY